MKYLKYLAALGMTIVVISLGFAAFIMDNIRTIEGTLKVSDIKGDETKDLLTDFGINEVNVIIFQGYRTQRAKNGKATVIKSKDMRRRGTIWISCCIGSMLSAIIGIIRMMCVEKMRCYYAVSPFISSFLLSLACFLMLRVTAPSGLTIKYGPSLIIAMVDVLVLFGAGVLICFSG